MNNTRTTLPRKIDLVQIEKGVEIYNTLLDLKEIVDALKLSSQNITNSEHIYIENIKGTDRQKLKIHDSWQRQFKDDIFSDLIKGKISGVNTIEDILVKLNSLDKGYGDIENTIMDIENLVRRICEEEAYDIVQSELLALENTIIENTKVIKQEILAELYNSFNENINEVNMRIGDLSGLHPYIGEALGDNNKTVKDAINFLFQLIVDLNENIILVNGKHGDNRAQLINSYNVKVPDPEPVQIPYPFVMPPDLGTIDGTNMANTITEVQKTLYKLQSKEESTPDYNDSISIEQQAADNMNLMSIADQIKYRKNLNRITEERWEDEE